MFQKLVRGLIGIGVMAALPVWGATLYEPFNTNSSNLPVDYPQFSSTGGGTKTVTGQELQFSGIGSPDVFYTTQALTEVRYLTAQMNGVTPNSPGNYNVGLYLGNNALTFSPSGNDNYVYFHPDYPGGALFVAGTGGFGLTTMPFTLSTSPTVLHTMRVTTDGAGNFSVTVIDGNNPANQYTKSWTNPTLTTFRVGLYSSTGSTRTVLFDNLEVAGVPEPSVTMLLLVGGLLAWRRGLITR